MKDTRQLGQKELAAAVAHLQATHPELLDFPLRGARPESFEVTKSARARDTNEIDVLNFADHEGLLDHDRLSQRLQQIQVGARAFHHKFMILMKARKTPVTPPMMEAMLRPQEVTDIANQAYLQYHVAFSYKLTMGEEYGLKHPGVSIEENKGYQAGTTYVDVVTRDALERLSTIEVKDPSTPSGHRELGNEGALKVLAIVIKGALHTLRTLKPRDEDPRIVDTSMQKLLAINPRLIQLPPDARTPANIVRAIELGPRLSGRAWRPINPVTMDNVAPSCCPEGTAPGRE